MVAALARIFGLHNLELAEDVVQDALCRALEVWKYDGLPENPAAWLMASAKNRAIDVLRSEKRSRAFAPDVGFLLETEWALVPTVSALFDEHELRDDQLRMMFSCCHPRVATMGQVTLILNILCGFSVAEIANAFMTNEASVEKRLHQGKKIVARSGALFEVAGAKDIGPRIDAVERALYLLFNEGYHGTHPETAVRGELCEEAMRLVELLLSHPASARRGDTGAARPHVSSRRATRPASTMPAIWRRSRTRTVRTGIRHSSCAASRCSATPPPARSSPNTTSRRPSRQSTVPPRAAKTPTGGPSPPCTIRSTRCVRRQSWPFRARSRSGSSRDPSAASTRSRTSLTANASERYPFYPAALGEFCLRAGRAGEAGQHLLLARCCSRETRRSLGFSTAESPPSPRS